MSTLWCGLGSCGAIGPTVGRTRAVQLTAIVGRGEAQRFFASEVRVAPVTVHESGMNPRPNRISADCTLVQ